MKLGVYAICKNEISCIHRWLECVNEADDVIIVDTGSTDGTWEKLQQSGVRCVQKIFEPFRFDVARNYALSLVPEDCDICLPLDPDMVISNGWCEQIKKSWRDGLGVLYMPMYEPHENSAGVRACHARKGCEWVFPTYEQLRHVGDTEKCISPIIIHTWHSGRPSPYIIPKLAKLSVEENPFNPYCRAMYEKALRDYGKFIEEVQP